MKTLKTQSHKINLQSFGKAMSQLDLRNVSPDKRKRAIIDHLMKIQVDTIEDREIAAQIELSRKLYSNVKENKVVLPLSST